MAAAPTADSFLRSFFADWRPRTDDPGRIVLDRLDADLRLAVELEGERLLGGDDAVLLAAERQFERLGAVARVLPLTGTARVLARYVLDPVYRPADPLEARVRLAVCTALAARLGRCPDLVGRSRLLRRLEEAIRLESGRGARARARRVRS